MAVIENVHYRWLNEEIECQSGPCPRQACVVMMSRYTPSGFPNECAYCFSHWMTGNHNIHANEDLYRWL
jgi:hypothetical protein